MFATRKNLAVLLLTLGALACSSGKKSGGKSGKEKQPLVSSAQTGSTPFAPRDQESATVSYLPDQDAQVAVWKSRVTMYAGTYDQSATLSLRLVPDGVIQTPSLTQVSPLVNFNAISSTGALSRSDMKKRLKVETIVDRYVNVSETVVIFIEHYGQENEARHMILPRDVGFEIQADESRLVTFETRDTDFAFAIAAAKGGSLQPGFKQYVAVPDDSTDLEVSNDDTVDEATEAKLTWTPSEGTRSGYRLEVSTAAITTVGCVNGEDLESTDIVEVRQNFPKVFTDSHVATGLAENSTIYFQLCSINDRDPPDASNGLNGSYELPKRALAELEDTPGVVSGATSIAVTVGGDDIEEYQYALRAAADAASCDGATYSEWTDVDTPISATGLLEGDQLLCVLGKKSDQNVQIVPTEYAWAVDLTPPGAFTISAIGTPTNDVTPTVNWAAASTAASYQIKVATDAGCTTIVQNITSSTTSTTATTLADGTYYVCVRALDSVGNGIDASNDGQTFVVDAIPPTFTSLVLANDVADGYLNAADHLLTADLGTLSASGHSTAVYALAPAATTCDGSLTYGAMPTEDSTDFGADGNYKVCVKLQDAATNTTYGTGTTFAKDVTVPAFTSLARLNDASDGFVSAAETANSTALAGTLSATGYDTATYKLVASGTACDVALTYGAMPASNSVDFGGDGTYKVCVKLTDAAGNPPEYGGTSNFTLDTAGPSAFNITAPTDSSTINDDTPAVTWSDPGDATEYTVKIDDAAGCPSPLTSFPGVTGLSQDLTPVPAGVWFVCVEALDAIGNATPATNDGVTFTIDTGSWSPMTTTSAPTARKDMSMVWDTANSKAIVFGGHDGSAYLASGGEYDPTGDNWVATDESDGDLPEVRGRHTAVWTGTQMIVWGGYNGVSGELQSGGVYTPGGPDYWTATATGSAPSARKDHTAIWSGSAMIVWGGHDGTARVASGGLYDPALDSWTATDELDPHLPSARDGHTALWTGTTMIVWGGNDGSPTNTGAIFDPAGPDYWIPITTTGAPTARYGHKAVWTGSKMIVWGGFDGSDPLNDGAIYDPAMDSWSPIDLTDAPSARTGHAAVWNAGGGRMIVWGGFDGTSALDTGAVYDPTGDSWVVPNAQTYAPASARREAAAVWTGTKMVIFGGTDGAEKREAGSFTPP